MFLQDKIKQGTIANELLKPVNFKLRMLFEDVGEGAFNVAFNFLPTVVIAAFFANLSAVKRIECIALSCQRGSRLYRPLANQLHCAELVVLAVQCMGLNYNQKRFCQYPCERVYPDVVYARLAEKRHLVHAV